MLVMRTFFLLGTFIFQSQENYSSVELKRCSVQNHICLFVVTLLFLGMEVRHAVNLIEIRLGERWQVGFIITLVVLTQFSQTFCSAVPFGQFINSLVYHQNFLTIMAAKAQLALMHNLFSIARQPITFPLNLLKTLKFFIFIGLVLIKAHKVIQNNVIQA